MAYISITDLTNVIDINNLQAMTDDYAQGQSIFQSTTLTNICQLASNMADAYVASIYPTPFGYPYPKKIYTAAVIFAAEMLYQRRLTPEEKNPFKSQADEWRKQLTSIGAGEIPLDESSRRGFQPVVAHTNRSKIDTNFF